MTEIVWITTYIAHRSCNLCANAADSARVSATLIGSVGATVVDDRTKVGGEYHKATVRRADHMMDATTVPEEERPITNEAEAREYIREVQTRSQATPTNFDGYLITFQMEGEGPAIWRVTRDQEATCEECGKGPKDTVQPLYRTISLISEFDPGLGICQDCVQAHWDRRLDPREPGNGDGARSHMFTGRPGNATA